MNPADQLEVELLGTMLEWRYFSLKQSGWPEPFAELLANLDDVDLHEACSMLERGCDPDTALRILLPLDLPLPAKHALVPPPPPVEVADKLGITIRVVS